MLTKEGAEKHLERIAARKVPPATFVLTYQCQGCKGDPEVFLVRREVREDGIKLILSGRSPIEHVEVPKSIPKKEADWYSGAIVAYDSGQELAALFLLRTFIEQFARRRAGPPKRPRESGDQLMERYMKLLPQTLKSELPSLRKVYVEISVALHEADPQKAPFEQKRGDVDRHFEALKLFQVKDEPPTAGKKRAEPSKKRRK